LQAATTLIIPFLLAIFLALITSEAPILATTQKDSCIYRSSYYSRINDDYFITLLAVYLGTSIAEFTTALPSYQARLGYDFR
jgi:hypothetical protein